MAECRHLYILKPSRFRLLLFPRQSRDLYSRCHCAFVAVWNFHRIWSNARDNSAVLGIGLLISMSARQATYWQAVPKLGLATLLGASQPAIDFTLSHHRSRLVALNPFSASHIFCGCYSLRVPPCLSLMAGFGWVCVPSGVGPLAYRGRYMWRGAARSHKALSLEHYST